MIAATTDAVPMAVIGALAIRPGHFGVPHQPRGCILGSCVGSAYIGRATVIDGVGAQLVVPGLVAVDLAQPVRGAVLGQPRCGIGGPDVDRVPRHVSGRGGGGHPAGSFLLRAVLRDRLAEELLLVRRGTPAAVDEELDPVVRGIGRGPAQGTEESWIEVGDTRDLVIEDRRAVGDGTVGLAERTTVLACDGRRCQLAMRARLDGDATSMRCDAAVEDEDASDW